MYDRTSESYWSQASGEGIVGKYAGKELDKVPFVLALLGDVKRLYPESKVLSTNTGFGRPYGTDPYGGYYTSPEILFPVSHRDDRLGPKEIIIGLENNGVFKAYRLQDIENLNVVNDDIGGTSIVLFSKNPRWSESSTVQSITGISTLSMSLPAE